MRIPFNKCVPVGNEINYVSEVVSTGEFGASGTYKSRCETWLKDHFDAADAVMTQSCTAALEMAAMLANIGPGDEVILPSFTFSSTANAFALRGSKLVFVDIDPVTLNIDPTQVEKALSEKTRVIVPVNYAGQPCDIAAIRDKANKVSKDILIIEDSAQALMAYENNKPVGSQSDLATISFHNTKNIACGEGGALIVNNEKFRKRSYILSEKGTNRKAFFLGEIDKYSWVDIGTSAIPSELTSALLLAQLEKAKEITEKRREAWDMYYDAFEDLERTGSVKRPQIAENVYNNAHMFYLLINSNETRNKLIRSLKEKGISAPFHYIPLHSAPAGLKLGEAIGDMSVTNRISQTLIRLPLWYGVDQYIPEIVDSIRDFFASN